MPLFLWLATLLGSLFSGIVTWFAQYVSKRVAIIAAVVTAIATLTTAFFVAVVSILSALLMAVPPEVSIAVGLFVPSNAYACTSAVLTAHTIRWVYEWNVKVIQFRLF